jgi:hypothetical protein
MWTGHFCKNSLAMSERSEERDAPRAQFRPCIWLFAHELRTEGEQRVPFVRHHGYKGPRRNPETRAKPAFFDNDSDMEMRP